MFEKLFRFRFTPHIVVASAASFSYSFLLTEANCENKKVNLSNPISPTNLQLKFAQVVFRHGARTPSYVLFDKDAVWNMCNSFPPEYQSNSFTTIHVNGKEVKESSLDQHQTTKILNGGCFLAQMTNLGYQQAVDLGKAFRQHYVDDMQFLSKTYHSDEICIRSTNVRRTIATASCVFSGIYSNVKKPVEINTLNWEEEWMFPNVRFCPKLAHFIKSGQEKIKTEVSEEEKQVQNQLRIALGMHENDTMDISRIRDIFASYDAHKMPLPQGITPELFNQVESIAAAHFEKTIHQNGTPSLRFTIGRFLQHLQTEFEDKRKHIISQKVTLYSGHDTTLTPLFLVLGLQNNNWTNFASSLCFEYYENENKQYFVRILYNMKEVTFPWKNGSSLLSLEEFNERIKPYISKDFTDECYEQQTTKLYDEGVL